MEPITTKEAAKRLGVTPRRIRKLITDKRLPAKRVGRDWLIDPRGLKAVEDRKTGRPKKIAAAVLKERQR